MIDWFASKFSLLLFVLSATGILMAFFFMQSEIMSDSRAASSASDIARLIDGVSDGESVNYDMSPLGNYKMEIYENKISLKGFVRYYISSVKISSPPNPDEIDNKEKITISRNGNTISLVGT